jgi:hypothetical protein
MSAIGYWEASCAVEEVGYKISSIKSVVEILAEREPSNLESAALWAVTEMLEVYEEKLDMLSASLMESHKEVKEVKEVNAKKEKKK